MTVAALGELLIDFVALESGVTVGEASGFIKAPGGAPANVAVALERLGYPAAFLGQVGDDPFGHFLADVLASEGVDVRGLRFTDRARTSLAFVSLAANGERSFMFYRHPAADMLMTPEDVAFTVLDEARAFHFGSITMIAEPARRATLAAADYARRKGLFISYDPNLRLALWPDAAAARAGMRLGFEYATLLKVSVEELEFLTGGHDARALWQPQLQLLVVTHGAQGAVLYTADAEYHQPGFAVDAVDTTGAGDAFLAALLAGLLEPPPGAAVDYAALLRYACAVGALTTTVKGAIPGLPVRAQVADFLESRP
ncbi:MAG: PfkB family carbohydrate kinase [Anaerolineae bacterium]|jgi:fructokinase|nr:PfkB family carbohydrate kinase [Anaerolineae bacterium]